MKAKMRRHSLGVAVAILTFVAGVIIIIEVRKLDTNHEAATVIQPPPPSSFPPPAASSKAADDVKQVVDTFVDGETLVYEDYVVQKQYKKVKIDYPREMGEPPLWVDVSYVVIKRKGKMLARFDGNINFGMGNSTDFGLFSFLGGEAKQLIVSQDIFRGGRQWMVSLSPRFRTIHDSGEFDVGREGGDMGVIDLDKDGIYEITQPVTAFYGFSEWIPTGRTPLPTIIFKFDMKAQRYQPANRLFQNYLLKDIEEKKASINGPKDRNAHLSDILSIVLDLTFAGKENEAWAFYEEAYKLPDKSDVRKKSKRY